MVSRRPRIVISALRSGEGKTFVTSILCALLEERGYPVQPFKYSADFVDAHVGSCGVGRRSRNLSYWTLGNAPIIRSFERHAPRDGISVIEGGAGLMDGARLLSLRGSTAEVASLLHAPVILVCAPETSPYTIVAYVNGLRRIVPDVRVAGIIYNRITNVEHHYRLLKKGLPRHTGIPVLGYIPHRDEWEIPPQFYPLLSPEYDHSMRSLINSAKKRARQTLNVKAILDIAMRHAPYRDRYPLRSASAGKTRIAIARGMAFYDLFPENINLLEQCGAETVTFCPMSDPHLPEDVDGLYISGRFPEFFARELAGNHSMIASIRAASRDGMPVYAESGGLKYLSHSITDNNKRLYRLAGIVPVNVIMREQAKPFGLAGIECRRDTPLLPKGATCRGYVLPCCRMKRLDNRCPLRLRYGAPPTVIGDGYADNNIFASTAHINWLTCPGIARRFVKQCAEYRKKRITAEG